MRLAVRTASGVILLAVLLGALFLGVGFLAALVGLLIAIALYEYRLLWRGQGLQPSLLVMAPLAAFWLFRYAYPQIPVASVGLLAGALVGLTISLGWQPSDRPVARWAVAMGGAVWLGYLPGCVLLLYVAAGSPGRAVALVLLTAGISIMGDTGAYLVGSWIGRHPFFPRISPKKTWEGAVVGWVIPTLVAGTLFPMVLPRLNHLAAYAIAAAAAAAAIAGDLAESQLKREVGVKDSGTLIPGHGGILDRVDSLLFVGAVVYSLLGIAHAF
ncbi:MAG: phosphatidate cytidylyltransferase [Candidatus Dormibacteraeota bacterium]|nr:phosphatidate cytidylyltransferase [Candidatus Dormibacteraeota bacterium]